jgi:phosphoribosylformylglycinamidine synthase subunit PurQ / glutaminase
MKFGVTVFPGSNCDHDAFDVLGGVMQQDVRFLWHKNTSLEGVDVVVIPGGFSYGDYLRCGAIARFSPIMKEVIAFANRGGIVVGICNGFQILCEAGLLPGAFLRNECLTFVCKEVMLRVENARTRFTSCCTESEVLRIPVAHGDGNFVVDDETLRQLNGRGQVLFRYCEPDGSCSASANPNGSRENIAGIMNDRGNVMGMMPNPERAADAALGSTDGTKVFSSIIRSFIIQEQGNDMSMDERR